MFFASSRSLETSSRRGSKLQPVTLSSRAREAKIQSLSNAPTVSLADSSTIPPTTDSASEPESETLTTKAELVSFGSADDGDTQGSGPELQRRTVSSGPVASLRREEFDDDDDANSVVRSDTKVPSTAERDMYGFLRNSTTVQHLAEDDEFNLSLAPRPLQTRGRAIRKQPLVRTTGLPKPEQLREDWGYYVVEHDPRVIKRPSLQKLIRKGIPPELRGRMWQLAAGCARKRREASGDVTDYFQSLLRRAAEEPGSVPGEIEKDLHRTFPDNSFYEKKEGLLMLQRVLAAYALHNPAVGYCQSMNFVCALLLLFMNEEDAFWMMCVIVEEIACVDVLYDPYGYDTLGVRGPTQAEIGLSRAGLSLPGNVFYHQADLLGVQIDQAVLWDLVRERIPKLYAKLESVGAVLASVSVNWFLCLFVNVLPLELTLLVWDLLFNEGVRVLFCSALSFLRLMESAVLRAGSADDVIAALQGDGELDCKLFLKTTWSFLDDLSMTQVQAWREEHRAQLQQRLRQRKAREYSRIANRHTLRGTRAGGREESEVVCESVLVSTPAQATVLPLRTEDTAVIATHGRSREAPGAGDEAALLLAPLNFILNDFFASPRLPGSASAGSAVSPSSRLPELLQGKESSEIEQDLFGNVDNSDRLPINDAEQKNWQMARGVSEGSE